jgi:hypothetical protein
MPLHIFQSRKTPELFAFTVDETGQNLPPDDRPWEKAGNAIPLGTTMASTSPEIDRQIESVTAMRWSRAIRYRSPVCTGMTASHEQGSPIASTNPTSGEADRRLKFALG